MGRPRARPTQPSIKKFSVGDHSSRHHNMPHVLREFFDMLGQSSEPINFNFEMTATVAELNAFLRDMVQWATGSDIATIVDGPDFAVCFPNQSAADTQGSHRVRRPQGLPRGGSQRVVRRRDSGRDRKRQQQQRRRR